MAAKTIAAALAATLSGISLGGKSFLFLIQNYHCLLRILWLSCVLARWALLELALSDARSSFLLLECTPAARVCVWVWSRCAGSAAWRICSGSLMKGSEPWLVGLADSGIHASQRRSFRSCAAMRPRPFGIFSCFAGVRIIGK